MRKGRMSGRGMGNGTVRRRPTQYKHLKKDHRTIRIISDKQYDCNSLIIRIGCI